MADGDGDLYQGLLDEVSIYNRALSASEIKAIANAGSAGKFDPAFAPPQNLAEARLVLAGVTNTLPLGGNNSWQTNTITFVATNSTTPLQISGLEPGMLLDSFNLGGFLAMTNVTVTTNVVTNVVVNANNLYYQPEVPLTPLIGTSALGDWQLEVLDNRAGATNPTPVLVDWQLEFEFANTNLPVTPVNIGNGPQTNVVGPGGIEWYQVQVPPNALAATNSLLFASLPVNLWYSINVPPTITRQNDIELLLNSTNGTNVIDTTTTTPTLAPGTTYYLGVQNTNSVAVTNVVQVTFLFGPSPPILPTIPTQVVAGGTTLTVANTATDTNAGAVLVYTLVNPPAVATIGITSGIITWQVPTNIAPTNVVITTIVTDTFTGLSATNSFVVDVLPGLSNGQPQTNVVAANGIWWYVVQMPTNAIGASNALVFATLPVNLWFSVNAPPTVTNANDFELLQNTTNGASVLGASTSPFVVPGATYYLGVQNTNSTPVTNAVQVTFLYLSTPPVLPNIPTQVVAGGNTLVVTNMATDTNAGAVLVYMLVNPPAGAGIDSLGTITWPTTTNLIGTNVTFTTIVTDTSSGLSATNSFEALVLSGLLNGQPQTNTIGTNSIQWYVVNVPINAFAATNALLSSTLPVNLWFSTNVPPTVTNPNDFEMLANQTSGTDVIATNTTPTLIPGGTYFLGVQNLNSTPVTSAVEVTFLFGLVPPILPNIPTQIISGGDTLVVTNTATDINAGATLAYTLVAPPSGATIDGNGIITWATTAAIAPTNVLFTTIALDSYGLSATNTFEVIVLPGSGGGQPQTNVVGTNSVEWYRIVVPSDAAAATNALLFASLPVNLWYSVHVPPTITNSGDIDLLSDVTAGTNVLTPATTPKLVPGSVYYLGVENTNAIPVTNVVQVTFLIIPPPVFTISSVTATNINGTNGFLVTWFAPTGYQFHLQWTSLQYPLTWQAFKGVISFNTLVSTTNAEFNYFDDGSQTGGFGSQRFYRLQLLNSPTNTAPFFVNGTPPNVTISALTTLTVPNPAADYDIPTQVLTYTLTDNVTGEDVPEIDPGSGNITWTPDSAQANTTNQFTTIVTDNGVPAKSATNTFTVIVTGAPSFSSIQVNTNGVFMQWSAPSNDEFQVRWTTNLAAPINWSLYPDFITSTNDTFNFTDTNTLDIMKFYQLILVP